MTVTFYKWYFLGIYLTSFLFELKLLSFPICDSVRLLSNYYYYYFYYYYYYYWLFNVMFWPVVIAAISSVRRVITNDQKLAEWSPLYISNTFLNIFAVRNNAVFCISPTFLVIPSYSIHLSNSFVTLPRVSITTGTTSTILSIHNLPNLSLCYFYYYFCCLHYRSFCY